MGDGYVISQGNYIALLKIAKAEEIRVEHTFQVGDLVEVFCDEETDLSREFDLRIGMLVIAQITSLEGSTCSLRMIRDKAKVDVPLSDIIPHNGRFQCSACKKRFESEFNPNWVKVCSAGVARMYCNPKCVPTQWR
jgi:hypothetical protein